MNNPGRMTHRRGIGAMLQLVIGILVVAILALVLFTTQSTTQAELRQSLTEASVVHDSKLRLMNLYETSYIVPEDQNPRLIKTIAFACAYAQPPSWVYESSEQIPIRYEVDEYMEDYFDRTFYDNYYFYAECDPNNQTQRLEIGEEPPEDLDEVLVARVEYPQPYENKSEAYLYRWQ